MSAEPCNFIWYELMTTDMAAAKAFYKAVIGWEAQDCYEQYSVFNVPGSSTGVAGLMAVPENACPEGSHPFWSGYIGVDDVDAYAQRICDKGGNILRGPEDIPSVGRFAVAADPHGAVFMIMKPEGEGPCERPGPLDTGYAGWRELHAGNGPEAFEFYSDLFGWTKSGAMPMGELGDYQMFQAGDGHDIGAMMTKMPDTPRPMWVYYFNVPSVNAAIEAVKANGGQILMGPHEVPGPMWIVQCFDPQGALFALVAPAP